MSPSGFYWEGQIKLSMRPVICLKNFFVFDIYCHCYFYSKQRFGEGAEYRSRSIRLPPETSEGRTGDLLR